MTNQPAEVHFSVNATTVKLPTFWTHQAAFWFRQAETYNSHFMESPATRPSSTTFSPPLPQNITITIVNRLELKSAGT